MSLNLETEFYHENFEIRKYRPSKFSGYTVINIPYLKLHNQCKICEISTQKVVNSNNVKFYVHDILATGCIYVGT